MKFMNEEIDIQEKRVFQDAKRTRNTFPFKVSQI